MAAYLKKETRMKKIVCLVLVLMIVSGLLFAAGGGQAAAARRISFHYWDENQRPGMDAVLAAFTRRTGIQVESTITPWAQYWTMMQIAVPSDATPDVFWLNGTNAADYLPGGLVHDITDLIRRDNINMANFPPALVQLYSYNGRNFGIPKDFDTIALFYNKAIFDARGVPYPTDNWTWTELRRAAEQLTFGQVHGFVAPPHTQSFLHSWVLSNGGTLMSPDGMAARWNSPQGVAAVREAFRFVQDGLSPTGADLLELNLNDRFNAGLAAMVTGGSWNVPLYYPALGANLGVARYPIAPGGRTANIIHGLSISISARSRNIDDAWELLKEFASREAGEAQARVVIPAFQGAQNAWMANYPTLNLQVFIDAAAIADPLPVPRRHAQVQNGIILSNLDNIWLGGMDVAAALANLDREAEAASRQ